METMIRKTPAWQVVLQIQRHGEMTIRELVDTLDVSTTAVRQQVDRLVGQGILRAFKRGGKRGRPSDVFAMTDRGHDMFTHRCDEILGVVLAELVKDGGEDETKELLRRVGNNLASTFADRIRVMQPQAGKAKTNGWKGRLRSYMGYLAENGIPADVQERGERVVFRQYCCPYHRIAKNEPVICTMDVHMLTELIGRPVAHSQCILDGGVACEFRISGSPDEGAQELGCSSGVA